ncbi:MAG TPA: hypothetical protein VGM23_06625 [Armatimonadota bacterium]|jgi:hypothetical protein
MPSNNYLEAFKEHGNLLGLASSVALSAALINPLPLLVGLVAEVAYLVAVPDSLWYRSRLSERELAEIARRRQEFKAQMLPRLLPEMQKRYARLEAMSRQISSQSGDGQKWFTELPGKFDYLLDKFLVFASKEVDFLRYLSAVREEVCGEQQPNTARPNYPARNVLIVGPQDNKKSVASAAQPEATLPADVTQNWVQQTVRLVQEAYTKELEHLDQLLTDEQDANTKAVLEKRKEILKRRAEFLEKIGKTLLNLDHQLSLLEDTFGLINDEVRARTPEQILADIDDVVSQTDSMSRLLEELAPYEQIVSSTERTKLAS